MKTAYNLVPPRFEDGRHEAIESGADSAGFHVKRAWSGEAIRPSDVICTWNLHDAAIRQTVAQFRAAGRPVVVFEEAYTRRLRPDLAHFAAALNGHNGAGEWFPGGPDRWFELRIKLKLWRATGRHVLVCSSRGMGAPTQSEPRGWAEDVARRLKRRTDRPVRIRHHPGKTYRDKPLEHDLEDCWAVVVWASNCATEALVRGIPVFYEGPHIVTEGAAQRGIERIEAPDLPERLPVLYRLAWAQWTMDEIAEGACHRHLLGRTG